MNRPRRLPIVPFVVVWAILGAGPARAEMLTFEPRVAAQEAIERVYYEHQIGASRPFEESISRSVMERKVRRYLGQSMVREPAG